jgi:hypothetical protein
MNELKQFATALAQATGGQATESNVGEIVYFIAGGSVKYNNNTYKVLLKVTGPVTEDSGDAFVFVERVSKRGGEEFQVVDNRPISRTNTLKNNVIAIRPLCHLMDDPMPGIVAYTAQSADVAYTTAVQRNAERAVKHGKAVKTMEEYAIKLAAETGLSERQAARLIEKADGYVRGKRRYDLALEFAQAGVC